MFKLYKYKAYIHVNNSENELNHFRKGYIIILSKLTKQSNKERIHNYITKRLSKDCQILSLSIYQIPII